MLRPGVGQVVEHDRLVRGELAARSWARPGRQASGQPAPGASPRSKYSVQGTAPSVPPPARSPGCRRRRIGEAAACSAAPRPPPPAAPAGSGTSARRVADASAAASWSFICVEQRGLAQPDDEGSGSVANGAERPERCAGMLPRVLDLGEQEARGGEIRARSSGEAQQRLGRARPRRSPASAAAKAR